MNNNKTVISKIMNASFLPKKTKNALFQLINFINKEEIEQLIVFLDKAEKEINSIEAFANQQKHIAFKATKKYLKQIRKNQQRTVLKLSEASVNKSENAENILFELEKIKC